MLSNQQFDWAKQLALRLAGIALLERHRELLSRRVHRVGVCDDAGFDQLLNAVEVGETTASRQFLRLLTTKFTGFFRHPRHFDLAAQHALRAASRHGRTRLWSAAAATGQEPWSLAIALIEAFGRDDPPADILAADIDTDALEMARSGEYGESALRDLELRRRGRFFEEVAGTRRWSVRPAARRLVQFRVLNLASSDGLIEVPFDVIFCRNVLMYLEASHRCRALERMASLLAPGGVLLLDPAEHPGAAEHLFSPGANGVYSLQSASSLTGFRHFTTARVEP